MFKKKPKQVESETIKAVPVDATPIPVSQVINPLVKLDVDKIQDLDDVKTVLRAMDIMFPRKMLDANMAVAKLCDESKFVNTRQEKAALISAVYRTPITELAVLTDKEIDEHYENIYRNQDHLVIPR